MSFLSRLAASDTFRSFRHANYRRFYAGNLLSNTGSWMQRIAQDWLVLDLTNSPQALGLVTALQFGPAILFSLHGGSLADRFDKRRWIIGTNAVAALSALVLGLLVVTDTVHVAHVYALAVVLGVAGAVQAPIWQAFVHDLVGPADLPNAIALNSTNFNIGRLLGPALSGYLIALFGTGPSFLLNGISYAASILALATMRTDALYGVERDATAGPAPDGVRAGLAYLRTRADVLVILALISVAGTFGLNNQMFMALMSRNVFGLEADSFGLLGSTLAVGSITGALATARFRGRLTARRVQFLVLGFGGVTTLAGLMPSYAWYAALLPLTGFSALMMLASANAFVQGTTDPAYRGRVMGVYMLVFIGGTPIGSLSLGWIAEHLGVRVGVSGFGAVVAVAAALTLLLPRTRLATAGGMDASAGKPDKGPVPDSSPLT